ncbi:MAG: family 16 glycosylhydrolase [Phycisphaerales bacterium JB039]
MKAALAAALCLWALASFASGQESVQWRLVWQDEFDGPSLDPLKWRAEDAALEKNNEQQYYLPDEVELRDGLLILHSRERQRGRRPYTSGMVETRDRFARAFGRFEVRARLPSGQGVWPAHWMLPASGLWPPEIDIMEMLGHEPHRIHMSNHWGDWPHHAWNTGHFDGPRFDEDFHTFAVEWRPGVLEWYIDGELRFRSEQGVPAEPFYLILNTAVGGNWPGSPDETTVFPVRHEIDYVRIYEPVESERCYIWLDAVNGAVRTAPAGYCFPVGAELEVVAEPDIGYRFAGWDGGLKGHSARAKVTLEENLNAVARFEPDPDAPARLKPVGPPAASSFEQKGFEPACAIDGQPGTRWSSAFAEPQWIMLDFGSVCDIRAVDIAWEASHPRTVAIQVSDDAAQWKTVRTLTKDSPARDILRDLDARGRYLRLHCSGRTTQYGFSIWELGVYGGALDNGPAGTAAPAADDEPR